MKLVVATGLYAPEIGGPATYVAMLEESLPQRGYDLTVVPFSLVRRFPRGIRHVIYMYKVWRASRGADAVYALDPISVGIPAMLVAKLRRQTFLLRLGGDYAWEQGRIRFGVTQTLDEYIVDTPSQPLRVRLLASLQSLVARRASLVIVPSQYLRSIVAQWDVPKENIQVIYSALHPIQPSASQTQLRQQLGYTRPTIISAGRLVPWKGFAALIKLVASYRAQGRIVDLVIVGDGPDREQLATLCVELDVSKQVQLIGRLGRSDLADTIAAADVFVLNTAYEGLSHQLVEVMDIGVPIVTTIAGGNRELITDGQDGYLVEFNNEQQLRKRVGAVIDSPSLRAQFVERARSTVRKFTPEQALSRLDVVLRQYLSK